MSLKPFDDPQQDPLKDFAPSPASSPSSLASLAASAAALAGPVPKELQLASSAIQALDALQAETPGSALQQGLQAAGKLNPNIAKAAQAASLVQQAAEVLNIAGHPLHGHAIRDFASPTAPFFPTFASTEQADDAIEESLSALAAIPQFTDGNRLLRFYSPLPPEKTLMVDTLHAHAALSEPFHLRLQLLSTHAGIELKELMGKNVCVGIEQADGSEHYFNGYIHHFAFSHADGGFAFYHAEVLPWMAFLTRRVNCRIFQDETVQQVIERVLREDYPGIADYQFRLGGKYQPENYIVQYHESDAHFLSRLMERYGLFYYYEHRADGHTLVISDDSCNAAFCQPHVHHAKVEFNGGHRTHNRGGISQLSAQRNLQSSRVALNTFDFKAPSAPQYVEQPTLAKQGDVPELEVFDGNPAFMYRNAGEGAQEAKQRLEVLEWQAKLFGGASDCRSLSPGRTFQLTGHHWFDGHDETDADFLVVSVSIDARNNFADRGNTPVYANSFGCIRRKIPYRPRRRHNKPRMPGPQTATVVGPKGLEIHTDPHGRIKVQFPWDRYGRHDERSSCWIRVSQPWAGAGWGTVAIPRIGQEVIVDYLEGDPDRPVCTGRLYNSAQPLPYALPGAAHVMGFKSRSTPGGGGYCEMVIHDRKGQELINIHSQKDMVTTVQHTQATVVNGPHQTNTVTNGFHVTKVKKRVELESQTEFIKLKAATGIVLEVGSSRIEMEANGKITIQGLHVDVIGTSRIDLNTNAKSNSSPVSNVSNSKLLGAENGIVPTQTAGHANKINHGALVNGKSPPKEIKTGQIHKPANDNKSGTEQQKQNRRVNPALEQRWKQAKPNIVAAANAADVDAGVLAKIAAFESGFDPNARPISKNAKMNVVRQFDGTLAISSAHGYGQFTDATWTASMRKHGEKYGVSNASQLSKNEAAAYRKDVRLQAAMLAELTKENIILGRKFGGESDDANVYALHNLGTGDGQKFLKALQTNPAKPVNSVLSANVIGGNPSLYGNGTISIADAYKRMESVMGANNVFADDARK